MVALVRLAVQTSIVNSTAGSRQNFPAVLRSSMALSIVVRHNARGYLTVPNRNKKMADLNRQDRQRGAFYGLAVGDALGAAIEFQAPGTFKPVVGYRDGGPHGLKPGEWTDDTSMALAMADSLATVGGFSMNDQLGRYVAWWQ